MSPCDKRRERKRNKIIVEFLFEIQSNAEQRKSGKIPDIFDLCRLRELPVMAPATPWRLQGRCEWEFIWFVKRKLIITIGRAFGVYLVVVAMPPSLI